MEYHWTDFGDGFGHALHLITLIQMILYWVDPSLPKLGKLRFKKTMVATCSLFMFVIGIDYLFGTHIWLKS
jgi:hypothetical protein